MFDEAKSEASHAADIYEKLGARTDLEDCRKLLRKIDELELNGELSETMLIPAHVNPPPSFKLRKLNEDTNSYLISSGVSFPKLPSPIFALPSVIFFYSQYPHTILFFSLCISIFPFSTSPIHIPWSPKYLDDKAMTFIFQPFSSYLHPIISPISSLNS